MKTPSTAAQKLLALSALINAQRSSETDQDFLVGSLQLALMAIFGPTRLKIASQVAHGDGRIVAAGHAVRKDVPIGVFSITVRPDGTGSASIEGVPVITLSKGFGGYAYTEVTTRQAAALRLRAQALVTLGGGKLATQRKLDTGFSIVETGELRTGEERFPYHLKQAEDGNGMLAVDLGNGFMEAARSQATEGGLSVA